MHTDRPAIADVIDDFHKALYHHFVGVMFMGVQTLQTPMDLCAFQEILFELRPELIIETGSYKGGSALFLACMCDILDHGRVISIDLSPMWQRTGLYQRPEHDRITWLQGDSVSKAIRQQVAQEAEGSAGVMVILDSDHSRGHVARELQAYAPMVSVGHYLIVQDTNVNGHPVHPEHGPGPWEAVGHFLEQQAGAFVIDPAREKWLVSFNPGGYLVRVA
jgi:cephalosporin hydroxylase